MLPCSKEEAYFDILCPSFVRYHYLLYISWNQLTLGSHKKLSITFLSCIEWAVVLHISWGVSLYQCINQWTCFKMVHIYTLWTITWLWRFGCKNLADVKQVDTIVHQHFSYLLIIYKSFDWNLKFSMASHWSWTVRSEMKVPQSQCAFICTPGIPDDESRNSLQIFHSFPQAFQAEAHSALPWQVSKSIWGAFCTRSTHHRCHVLWS